MSWDHEQYVKFVRKQALTAKGGSLFLLQAASKPYSDEHSKLFLTYYSMPDWLDVFSSAPSYDRGLARPRMAFDKRLGTTPFDHMIAEYKHAAKKHQDKVAEALDQIASVRSGQALLKEIGSTGYRISVMPYWHYFMTLPYLEFFNALTRPIKPDDALSNISLGTYPNLEDASERNSPIRGDDNEPTGEKGTGKGVNVVIFFSAEIWESKGAPNGPGDLPDEVLFHELTHATRMIRGRMTHVPVEGGGGYGNIEEYFATVITNVYISEKAPTAALRGLYANDLIRQTTRVLRLKGDDVVIVTTDPLPTGWSAMKDPEHFYENIDRLNIPPRQLMQIFSSGPQKTFYRDLAFLPEEKPKFNPPRLHFSENHPPPKK
jgi:Effector protein